MSNPRQAGQESGDATTRVGAYDDIVSRDVFGTLLELDAAYARLKADRVTLLKAAGEEAAQIIASADAEAERIRKAATIEYQAAADRGFHDGMAKGVGEWLEHLAQTASETHRVERTMHERMAEIVMGAVEQIVRSENTATLFERALEAVDRIIEGATYLRVTVNSVDYLAARTAFDALAAHWRELGRPLPVSVVPDKRLEPGSCMCESDLGIIDASISTQLRTMQTAVARVLKDSVRNAITGEEG